MPRGGGGGGGGAASSEDAASALTLMGVNFCEQITLSSCNQEPHCFLGCNQSFSAMRGSCRLRAIDVCTCQLLEAANLVCHEETFQDGFWGSHGIAMGTCVHG